MSVAQARDAAATGRILRGLPDWFGIEEAIVEYERDTDDDRLDSFIAFGDQTALGVGLVSWPQPRSAEIHLLAVDAASRRSGIGTILVQAIVDHARKHGAKLLSVHTVGPSFVNEPYAQTRRFYEAAGFLPLREFDNIDWNGPTLVMVRPLWELPPMTD